MAAPTGENMSVPDELDKDGWARFLRGKLAGLSSGETEQETKENADDRPERNAASGTANRKQYCLALEEAQRFTSTAANSAEVGNYRVWWRVLARAVLFLARTITGPQQRVNQAILEMLQALLKDRDQTAERMRLALAHANDRVAALESGRLTGNSETPLPRAPASSAWADLYLEFEDRFRGNREMIRERLKVYVPSLQAAGVGTLQRPLVDLGSGRGEWLELAVEQGWVAWGVDANKPMADACRQRGLKVMESDILKYLRGLPSASLGAITAFHVLEHLPVGEMIGLLLETARVLAIGGLAIFETPNPENLVVGACTFHIDLTHQRPLHPELLRFMVERCGLDDVQVLRLGEHRGCSPVPLLPIDQPLAGHLNPLIEAANLRLFGPPDYAIVARKTA